MLVREIHFNAKFWLVISVLFLNLVLKNLRDRPSLRSVAADNMRRH